MTSTPTSTPGPAVPEDRSLHPAPAAATKRRRRQRNIAVAALFLVFGVVELWAPIFHGQYFLPGDFGQASVTTKVAHGPKMPRNQLESDVYDSFAPFLHFDSAQVAAGHFPTWNPYDGNGQPYLADAQTVVVSPFSLPFYFLSFRLALIAASLARLWLLGFFMYLFLARHRIRTEAAVVGGLIFAYAGYHVVFLDYQTHVSVSATIPVALWCLRVALDHRGGAGQDPRRSRALRTSALVSLSIILGLMVLDGHPETAVFGDVLVFGYALGAVLYEHRDRAARLRWAGRIAGVAVLAVGISAVQLLPFLQYTSEGYRPGAFVNNAGSVAGYAPDTVPLMAFPNLFGAPGTGYNDAAFYAEHHPADNYAEADSNSVGLLAVCLVPLGLVSALRRRNRTLALFGIGAGVVGSVMLYTRWAGLLWRHLPIIGAAGLFRSQDVQIMGVAVLGALGADWILRSAADPALRRRAVSIVVGCFAVVNLTLLLWAHSLVVDSRYPSKSTLHSKVALHVVQGNLNIAVVVAEGFALALIAAAAAPRQALRWAGAAAMVVLAFVSSGGVLHGYNTSVNANLFYPRTHAVKELARTVGSEETLFTGGTFPVAETNLWFGLYDVGSYDGIGLKWHDALYEKVFHEPGNTQAEQLPSCIEGLQLFGVQWVLGGSGQFLGHATGGLTTSKTIDKLPIYPVDASNLVGVDSQVMTSTGGDRRALAKVSSCSFHSDNTVLLDLSPYDPSRAGTMTKPVGIPTLADTAKILSRSATTMTLRTTSPTSAWAVVRESWEPGWTATVDGRPAAVDRADVAFQAVHVPAGTHIVRLSYRSSTVTNGVQISIMCTFIAAGLLLLALGMWRAAARPRAQSVIRTEGGTS